MYNVSHSQLTKLALFHLTMPKKVVSGKMDPVQTPADIGFFDLPFGTVNQKN